MKVGDKVLLRQGPKLMEGEIVALDDLHELATSQRAKVRLPNGTELVRSVAFLVPAPKGKASER